MVLGTATLAISIWGLFGTAGDENFAKSDGLPYSETSLCRPGQAPTSCHKSEDATVVSTQPDAGESGSVTAYQIDLSWPGASDAAGFDQWVEVDAPSAAFVAAVEAHDTVSAMVWNCGTFDDLQVDAVFACDVESVTAGGITQSTAQAATDGADPYQTGDIVALAVLEFIALASLRWGSRIRFVRAFGTRQRSSSVLRWAAGSTTGAAALLAATGTLLLGAEVVAAGITLVFIAFVIVVYAFFVPWLVPGLLRRQRRASREVWGRPGSGPAW